jgi:hypothetical protein
MATQAKTRGDASACGSRFTQTQGFATRIEEDPIQQAHGQRRVDRPSCLSVDLAASRQI